MVDEVLAGALLNQDVQGARTLGLVRDTHRILSGARGLERPGEIVEACVRSAADALLKLPGVPKSPAGLQSAARDLLDAVDAALPAPAAAPAAVTDAGWERIRDAAEVLRGEVHNPGALAAARELLVPLPPAPRRSPTRTGSPTRCPGRAGGGCGTGQVAVQSRSCRAIRATPRAPDPASRTKATAALGG